MYRHEGVLCFHFLCHTGIRSVENKACCCRRYQMVGICGVSCHTFIKERGGQNRKPSFRHSQKERYPFRESIHREIYQSEKEAKRKLTKNERIFVESMKFTLGQLSFEDFFINVSTINEK